MFNEKKIRFCPICSSEKVQKWGNQNGKQRYRCSDCFHNFSLRNKGVQQSNQFIWFRKWIMERQVYQYLIRDSGMSQRTIQRLFKDYLKKAPKIPIRSKTHVHLLIDGTYFSNGLCLILYYNYDIQYVQLYRETNKEKLKEIKEDLQNLKRLGVDVYSVTCDGHSAILKSSSQSLPKRSNTAVFRTYKASGTKPFKQKTQVGTSQRAASYLKANNLDQNYRPGKLLVSRFT